MIKLHRGFTLIELLVVMAIIATLLSMTVPRYFHSVDKSKEVALHGDLSVMRDAIDKYFSDHAKYPDSLDELVEKKYLRSIPVDPMTDSNQTWTSTPPEGHLEGRVRDVKSGAKGVARVGSNFSEW